MRKTVFTALTVLALSGCTTLPHFDEKKFEAGPQREAYIMGSAHAGLRSCAESLDPHSLDLHELAARRAAVALGGARPEQLLAAYEAGLREGGGADSPHRLSCEAAEAVLRCSLNDYLGQWRTAEFPPK